MSSELCGWVDDKEQVAEHVSQMPIPCFFNGVPKGNENVLLYEIYREIAGEDDLAAQGIGDCVSWGWKHLTDFTQAVEIKREINELVTVHNLSGDDLKQETAKKLFQFEMTASEVIYALSRVEIGGGKIRGDGSVGAWAARAVTEYGTLSYKQLERSGQGGTYDPNRARNWGARGLPDTLEPESKKHILATTSQVRNFSDAAALIESGYGVAICSDVGFENARNGSQTLRDEQGFASARGTWNHCMFGSAIRYDRPGICIINQWPPGAFAGPLGLNQPKNSFWVDERTINTMLSQGDSFTASRYNGYPMRPLTYRF